MQNQRHIIEKQTLHIRYHDAIAAGKLQKMLSDWLRHSLQPAMDTLFNELDRTGYRLRMDALEINAGDVQGNNWQQQLTEKVCSELKQKIRSSANTPIELPAQTTVYSDTEKYELLRYYLKHGQLPWYATGVASNALHNWMNKAVSDGFFYSSNNLSFLMTDADALLRLLWQARQSIIDGWFIKWNRSVANEWMTVLLPVAKKIFGNDRWAYALLFERLAGRHQNPLWQKILKEKWNVNDALADVLNVTNELLEGKIPLIKWKKDIAGVQSKLEKKPPAGKQVIRGGFYIQNAGLVILHPFLPVFYTNLLLLKNRDWVNEEAHNKAVLILNYLATSSFEMAEYELPLCKLLCGWPVSKPIGTTLVLSNDEKQECRLLLQTIISHWSILKTSSVETLQSSFLQRNGKLTARDNGWLLQVEQQTIDILVQHLPWTISVARNSLMQEVLHTEWV